MNLSTIERDDSLGHTVIAFADKLNTSATPVTATMDNRTSVTITEVGNLVNSNTQPKDIDNFVNLDDVNVMKKMTIDNKRLGDSADVGNRGRKPPTYAAKKTVAQGMMDIALLTSNANQLRNLIEYQSHTITFWVIFFMIVLSLVLQVAVGVSLIFKGRFDTKGKDKAAAARVNKWMMSGVFLITIINIFIAVFSTGPPAPSPPQLATPTTIQNPAQSVG